MPTLVTPPSVFRLHRHAPRKLHAALAAAGLLVAQPALAAPRDGTVVAGSATITQTSPLRTDINQTTQRAVIDWRSFDIGASELVNFQLPSASSATLNRVTGGQATSIQGQLRSNGQLYLVNPNGILFGAGAQVDVGALVATTANTNNSDFMAGRSVFNTPGSPQARVVNQGRITAAQGGLVALLAPSVANSGVIAARLGTVMLAAGRAFTLDLQGDGLVRLSIDQAVAERIVDVEGRPLASLVSHDGQVLADGGRVLMSVEAAREVVDQAIHLGGLVQARTVQQQGGEIVLSGGSITVAPSAHIDVSGSGGLSNGGRAVLIAQDSMRFNGSVDARGAGGGDGGFVEVSGKQDLHFSGRVDASSAGGRAGTLLLDPVNITVDAALAQTLSAQLASGTSVVLQADQNVTVSSTVDGRSTGTPSVANFTVNAGNGITLNESVLTANGAISLTAGAGGISMASGRVLHAGARDITLVATGNMSLEHLVTSGAVSVTTPGLATLNQALGREASTGVAASPIGSFSLVSNATTGLATATVLPTLYATGNVSVTGLRPVTVSGGIRSGSVSFGTSVVGTSPATILVNAPLDTSGGIVLRAADNITVSGNAGLSAGGGASLLSGAGGITMSAASSIEAATQIVLDASGSITTGALHSTSTFPGEGTVSVNSSGGSVTTLDGVSAAGAATLTADDDLTIGSDGVRSAGMTLEARTNDITVRGPLETTGTGQTTLIAGRDIVLDGTSALIRSRGDITLTAGRALNLSAAGTATGPSTVVAGTSYEFNLGSTSPDDLFAAIPNWPQAGSYSRVEAFDNVNNRTVITYSRDNFVVAEITYVIPTVDGAIGSMNFRTRNSAGELVDAGQLTWTRTSNTYNFRHVTIDCVTNCNLSVNADIVGASSPTSIIDSRSSSVISVTTGSQSLSDLDGVGWRLGQGAQLRGRAPGNSTFTSLEFGRSISNLFDGGQGRLVSSLPDPGAGGVSWPGDLPFDDSGNTGSYFGRLATGGVPIPRGVDNNQGATFTLGVDTVTVSSTAVPLPNPRQGGVEPTTIDASQTSSVASGQIGTSAGDESAAPATDEPETLLFDSGRGVARSADLGRDSAAQGQPAEVFCGLQHVAGVSRAKAPPAAGATYFQTDSFGRRAGSACGKRGAAG